MAATLNALTGWLLFASLVTVLGAAAGRWLIPPDDAGGTGRHRRSAAALGVGGGAALLVALALVLARQILEFRDPFVPWQEDARLLLTATPWGRAWGVATLAAVVAPAGFLAAWRGRSWGWWVALPAVLGLGAFPAFTGHANAGDPRALTLAADILHVWAAGGWMGGLALVLLLERAEGRRSGGASSVLPLLVPRFSRLAMVGVAALVATGLLASWSHLDGPAALVGTAYGRLLLGKVSLAAAVLAMGAVNYRRWTPLLGTAEGRAGMRRTASVELALAAAVLAVTALLVRTSP